MLCQYVLKTSLHFIISKAFFKKWIINSKSTINYAVSFALSSSKSMLYLINVLLLHCSWWLQKSIILSLLSFLSLSHSDHLLSVISARSQITYSRIILRTRSILLHLVHSFLVYMKSSFRKIKRMRKCLLLKIARQKTRDFHQRCDEKDVNFFNNKHVRWFFCF